MIWVIKYWFHHLIASETTSLSKQRKSGRFDLPRPFQWVITPSVSFKKEPREQVLGVMGSLSTATSRPHSLSVGLASWLGSHWHSCLFTISSGLSSVLPQVHVHLEPRHGTVLEIRPLQMRLVKIKSYGVRAGLKHSGWCPYSREEGHGKGEAGLGVVCLQGCQGCQRLLATARS